MPIESHVREESADEQLPAPNGPRLVSVIMPVLNAAGTLEQQFEALSAQTYEGPWEVIISDNGSTDGTVDLVGRWIGKLPSLRVIDSSTRAGASHARNTGAEAARGNLLLFCDGDDVCQPGWIEALVDALGRFDMVGGWIDSSRLNDPIAQAWRVPFPQDRLPVALRFLPYAPGGNMGIQAEVLREIGGWREDYVGGGEDVEFAWRAQLASYRLGFAPDAIIEYRHRADLQSLGRQFFRFGLTESRLYRDFRSRGVPRSHLRVALAEWAWIIYHVPDLFRAPAAKGAYVRKAAHRCGRLLGSLRHRTLFL